MSSHPSQFSDISSDEALASLPENLHEGEPVTAIQDPQPYLLHLQTTQVFDVPLQAAVRLGKANDRCPPDLDLTNIPDADIVSRVHAEILHEGEAFYIADLGSSNGTFVNHAPLVTGQRHRLVPGDLISLGKEDKVTFVFKI
ncbi:MAG: FHA domain-containing protein [Cyanobacteria bacterium J06641_5]